VRILSKKDAIDVYIVAAMYASDGWPMQPSAASVEEIGRNVYRINSPEQRDNRGKSLPSSATCAYNEDAQEWLVTFPDDQIVKLRDVNGQLSVVTE
jgi:hypothetical protein